MGVGAATAWSPMAPIWPIWTDDCAVASVVMVPPKRLTGRLQHARRTGRSYAPHDRRVSCPVSRSIEARTEVDDEDQHHRGLAAALFAALVVEVGLLHRCGWRECEMSLWSLSSPRSTSSQLKPGHRPSPLHPRGTLSCS